MNGDSFVLKLARSSLKTRRKIENTATIIIFGPSVIYSGLLYYVGNYSNPLDHEGLLGDVGIQTDSEQKDSAIP